jgi:hypothetical protein
MNGYWLGWVAGMALSLFIVLVLFQVGINVGFIGGVLLGFGLSQICGFIGMKAYQR